MKTYLRSTSFKSALVALAIAIAGAQASVAQNPASNLIFNSSFEFPSMPILNGNNIIGAAIAWNGWNCTNGGLNIIHVTGSGYNSGANHAKNGDQYVDVNSTDGYISTTFVLLEASPVSFSGSFSNREAGWAGYINWTGRVDILDLLGNVVGSSNTMDFVASMSNEDWYSVTGTTSTLLPGIYTYRAYAGNWGHFDDAEVFALSSSVLPVKLTGFGATLKDKGVEVEWNVTDELHVKNYEVQFGTDGRDFKTVGSVTATNSKSYQFNHAIGISGTAYYRLRMVDEDGRSTFSNTSKVSLKGSSSLFAYPNPASNVVNIGISSSMVKKPGTLNIISMNGRLMKRQEFKSFNQQETIDVSRLAPGNYVVSITNGYDAVTKTIQVIR